MARYPSLSSLVILAGIHAATAHPATRAMVYSFDDVPPSSSLQWTPCYDDFTCANLIVPLDYDDTAAGETTVAFIQHASNVTGAQDILINPGGPGGSGTAILRAYKQRFRSLLGQGYNLVGFDPRGVGSSGLRLDCVPDNPALTAYYDAKLLEPIDPGSKDSLTETFALAGGFGQLCSHTHSDGKAGYANSVAVAADMLHFATLRAPDGTPEADVLVNYYGASYGTALGTAFAALHPEHVGKFILDAVVDGEDYFKGGWKENLLQADDCVRSFSRFCFEAKEKCAFYADDASVSDVQARFDAVLTDLKENPIAFYDPATMDYPAVVTYRDLQYNIWVAIYNTVKAFPSVATIMAQLEHRNASALASAQGLGLAPKATCDYSGATWSSDQARSVISCNDADGRYPLDTEAEWESHVAYLVDQSSYIGATWAAFGAACRSYDVRAPRGQVFAGYDAAGTKTATPVLFVRNTLDPVAPAAEKMSGFFDGSAVLTLDGVGHSALVITSQCINDRVQAYLEDGVLPEEGVVCDADVVPFLDEW